MKCWLLFAALLLVFTTGQSFAQTAEALFEKGRKFHAGEGVGQDLSQALSYYKQALKRDADLYEALYNSGMIYHEQKDYARAHTLFIKAAKAAKNMGGDAGLYGAMARNGLGSSYQKLGKEAQAEKQFAIAKRLYPSFVEAHHNHINLLILQKRFAAAQKALQVAVKLAPSDRYEKFKGRLKAVEKSKESWGGIGVAGMVAFVVLLLLYSMFLRHRAKQNR